MKIGIYSNLERDIGGAAAKTFADALKKRGHQVLISKKMQACGIDAPLCTKEEMASKAEIIAVFGGDGTVLHIAETCARKGARILAVNLGNLGFLSEFDNIQELLSAIGQLEKGEYKTEPRALLEICYRGDTYHALNEAVLARGPHTKLLKFRVSVNGSILNHYKADGLIVSTPTGSTAYSLSAGGPVVAPEVKAMVISPICAHGLNNRSYIVSDESEVSLELIGTEDYANLNIDGEDVCPVPEGGVIRVRRSDLTAEFIRFKRYDYYTKLLAKMNSLN
jgi:NAD+ kinase